MKVDPEMKARPNPFRWDRVVGISSIFISFCALAVSMFEVNQSMKAQRASVWPYIDIAMHAHLANDSVTNFSIWLSNGGIGPAIIEALVVTVDGQVKHTWEEVLACFEQGEIPLVSYSHTDRILPISSETSILRMDSSQTVLCSKVFKGAARVHLLVCYRSVYDEHFTAERSLGTRQRMLHKEVEACPIAEQDRFQQ